MKKTILSFLVVALCLSTISTQAQSVFGKWKTIDDDGVTEKSIVEIFERDGKAYGKVVKLLDEKRGPNPKCIECKGKKKDQPILGMEFLSGLSEKDQYWQDGTILDPENGKEYSCFIELEEGGEKLKVRGYMGFSLLGRSQYWFKVAE